MVANAGFGLPQTGSRESELVPAEISRADSGIIVPVERYILVELVLRSGVQCDLTAWV